MSGLADRTAAELWRAAVPDLTDAEVAALQRLLREEPHHLRRMAAAYRTVPPVPVRTDPLDDDPLHITADEDRRLAPVLARWPAAASVWGREARAVAVLAYRTAAAAGTSLDMPEPPEGTILGYSDPRGGPSLVEHRNGGWTFGATADDPDDDHDPPVLFRWSHIRGTVLGGDTPVVVRWGPAPPTPEGNT